MSNTAGRKVSDGEAVDITVPMATTLQQGEFAYIDGFFGFNLGKPKTDTTAADTRPLTIAQQEFETDQIVTTDAFNKGDLVYFNTTSKLLSTSATGAIGPVGRVTVAKDVNNVIWLKLFNQRSA